MFQMCATKSNILFVNTFYKYYYIKYLTCAKSPQNNDWNNLNKKYYIGTHTGILYKWPNDVRIMRLLSKYKYI